MDSTLSNSIGAPQLSKFDDYIMDFENFWLNFYWISLKTNRKISPFRLTIRLHLFKIEISMIDNEAASIILLASISCSQQNRNEEDMLQTKLLLKMAKYNN